MFILKNLIRQPHRWASLLLFVIASLLITGQLLSMQLNPQIAWTFYLMVQNFTIALLLKDAFCADIDSQRLHYIDQQPFNLMCYLISTTVIYSTLIFVIQLAVMPVLSYLFLLDMGDFVPQIIMWQAASALLLTVTYLFGATLTQNNRMGIFFNLTTVMPLMMPWFLLSFEFLIHHDIQALLAILALLLLLLPIMLYSQYLVLCAVIRL